jgi:dTDP-glucose 4,6-dehydratase
MAIFVTGGAGFIGSQFVREWVERCPSNTVINFDKLTYAGNLENLSSVASHPSYRMIRGDICDASEVLRALPHNCEAIVHFAAESHVDRSILSATEFVRTNVLGTQVLLDAARARNVRRFLHISTDEVGGSIEEGRLFHENSPLAPSSPYAASKTAAEHLVLAAVHTFGLNAVVTRTSNNYGPWQFPEKLLPLAISNAMEGRPIPVYGDGLQIRDWVHVADNTRALRLVLEKGRPGAIYHIGGRTPLTNREVLRTILGSLGRSVDLLTPVADRLGHDRRYAVDCSLIERELGWRPEIDFVDGIRQTIDWYRTNTAWVSNAKSGEYRNYYERLYGHALVS